MIAIIDYGVGNLFSLRSSLARLGLEAVVTADADTIRTADRLIASMMQSGDAKAPKPLTPRVIPSFIRSAASAAVIIFAILFLHMVLAQAAFSGSLRRLFAV